ncbi:RNA polymerase sigma factor SigW [soil metagenome]
MSISFPLPQLSVIDVSDETGQSDLASVERAKQDPGAFAELYGRYLDPVCQYCFRRLDSREAAEDATSQVFMQALAGLPRFDGNDGSFRAWLFRIAHNVVIDQYRAARPTVTLELDSELTDQSSLPEDLVVDADRSRTLRQAIEQFPERQRQVVELRLAGLNGPEIGEVLGCRARTVDVAQFRAVARLRSLLGVTVAPEGARDV